MRSKNLLVETVSARFVKAGKRVRLKHLSEDCLVLLDNANFIDVNYYEAPSYKVVSDKLGG